MAYSDDILAAQITHAAAHKAAVTDAQHIAADAAYRQAAATAAQKWGVKNGSLSAITARGEVPPAGSWTPGAG